MAWAKVVQITCPASTGEASPIVVSGVGSAPVGFIAVHGSRTTTGFTGEYRYGIGYGVSSSQQIATACCSENDVPTSDARRRQNPNACITCLSAGGTVLFEAALVSMGTSGSDGTITLNWGAVSEGMQVNLLVFGGEGVEASITAATNGSTSFAHGLSSAPDFLATAWMSHTTTTATTQLTLNLGFGVWAGGNQYALSNRSVHGAATSSTSSRQIVDRVMFMQPNLGNHEITSVDSTDVNYTSRNSSGGARYCWYLSVTGIMAQVGAVNSPTAGTEPVDQAITLTGMNPQAGIFATWMRATSSSEEAQSKFSIGVADATTEVAVGAYDETGADTTNTARFSLNKTVEITNVAEADLAAATSTFASEQVTLSWDPIDTGESHEVFYLILGEEAGAAPAEGSGTLEIEVELAGEGRRAEGSGTVEIEAELTGTAHVASGSGEIEVIADLDGASVAATGSGEISVEVELVGAGQIAAGSGEIEVEAELVGTGHAAEGSGDLEIEVELVGTGLDPDPADAEGSGVIDVEVELVGSGQPAQGSGVLEIDAELAGGSVSAQGSGAIEIEVELVGAGSPDPTTPPAMPNTAWQYWGPLLLTGDDVTPYPVAEGVHVGTLIVLVPSAQVFVLTPSGRETLIT